MSYTNGLDDPRLYFNSKLYTGTGSSNSITGIGFAPDWVWIKNRGATAHHMLFDTVRGATKVMYSNLTDAETTVSGHVTSFDSDGFTLGDNSGKGSSNGNTETYVAWNWLAGGTAPTQTYTVKVVSDSGNKYRFDDFGTSAVTLDLQEGGTYIFDQSDSSNSGHPLRFSTTSDGTHGSGSEYTTGVTTNGTPGSSGAFTQITVAASAPTLYYYCSVHSGMGGQANTNSTFGSSNFSGSVQSTVSANTTAGFSIATYTGNKTSGATIGTGLDAVPSMVIIKNRTAGTDGWLAFHKDIGNTKFLYFSQTNAPLTSSQAWNNTTPDSSVVTLGNSDLVNGSSENLVAYCFAEKKGYSKIGSYTGNNSSDGTFLYLGFKPALAIIKDITSTDPWHMIDNKRSPINLVNARLFPNSNNAENTSADICDFVSNGIKFRGTNDGFNGSRNYIYYAVAESPFVNSNGVPTNAR